MSDNELLNRLREVHRDMLGRGLDGYAVLVRDMIDGLLDPKHGQIGRRGDYKRSARAGQTNNQQEHL